MGEVSLEMVDESVKQLFSNSVKSLSSDWYTDVPSSYQQEDFSSSNYMFGISDAVLSSLPTKIEVTYHIHKPINENFFLTVLACSMDETSCLVQVILSEGNSVQSLLNEGNPRGRVVDYETVEYQHDIDNSYDIYCRDILSSVMEFVDLYGDTELDSLYDESRSARDICSDRDYPHTYADFAPY